MADELVGWEIVARLSVDDADFKSRLRQAEQTVEQTRQKIRSATTGGGGGGGGGGGSVGGGVSTGGTVMFGGRRMPVSEAARHLGVTPEEFAATYGGGGSGGAGWRFGPPPSGGNARGGTLTPPSIGRPEQDVLRMSGGRTLAPPPIRAAVGDEVVRGNVAFSGPNLIGESRARAKALTEEEQASKGNRRELGLRTAWMLRAATAGGPAGMLGGGVGAVAGMAFGNAGFGSLVGNWAGQSLGGIPGHVRALVGESAAGQGAAHQFDRAVADVQGVIGRSLVPTLDYFTQKTRLVGDALAGNEGKIKSATGFLTGTMERFLEGSGFNQFLRNQGTPGGSAGAGVGPLAGHVFSGRGAADEVWAAIARQTMMGLGGPRAAANAMPVPTSTNPLAAPGLGLGTANAGADFERMYGLKMAGLIEQNAQGVVTGMKPVWENGKLVGVQPQPLGIDHALDKQQMRDAVGPPIIK